MPTAKYLLLVIDLLNDFFRQHARLAAQRSQLAASVNRLAAAFRQSQQPVLWVRQEFAPDLSDAFLRMRRENLRGSSSRLDHLAVAYWDGSLTEQPEPLGEYAGLPEGLLRRQG